MPCGAGGDDRSPMCCPIVFLASVELSINKNLNLKNLPKGPNNDVRRLDLFIL